MTVIRPNSVSGINSITAQADEIKVFKSNGTQGGLIIGGANLNATSGISTLLALNVTGNVSIAGTLTYQDVTNIDSVGVITARSTIDAQGDVFIADKIVHSGDTNTSIRFLTNDTITAETNGSERLRIMSNGNIGIGTVNAGAPLHIESNNAGFSIRRSGQYLDFDGNFGGGGDQAIIASSGIRFYTSGYSNMRAIIDSSGRLLIGTNTEGAGAADRLTIASSATAGMTIRSGTSNQGNIYFSDGTSGLDEYRGIVRYDHSDNSMSFRTDATERLRIDSNGNIGVGIVPSAGARLQIVSNDNPIVGTRYNAGADGSVLFLQHSRSNTIGAGAALNDNDEIGAVQFRAFASDNSSIKNAAFVRAEVNGTTGSAGVPADLIFGTGTNSGNAAERVRITSSGKMLSTLTSPNPFNTIQTNLELLNGAGNTGAGSRIDFSCGSGKAHIQSQVTDGNSTNGLALVFATSPDANGADERLRITPQGAFYIKSPNSSNGDQPGEIQWWNENGAGVMAKIVAYREGGTYAPSGLKFYTTQNVDTSANNSQGNITERLFINSEGKFYKGGHQFYPCVQIYEARISGAVSNSTTGSYQDIKTVATYTPKKVGNRVHVQVICQTWNGSQSDGSADAYARLQHNNGGSYSTFTECDRVQGNFAMDERYHHNPFIMDGWFTTTTTNSTTIKFQGNQAASLPVAFQWFHSYGGRITIMEYDIT